MSFTVHWLQVVASNDPVHIDGQLDVSELLKDRKDVVSSGTLNVQLRASVTSNIMTVEGNAVFTVTMMCGRCLTHIPIDMEVPILELLTRDLEIAEADEEEMIRWVENDEIDLQPIIEENALLSIPLVALCDEHCKGLCPSCGKNKNESECSCVIDTIDPRLAGLKDFFNRQ